MTGHTDSLGGEKEESKMNPRCSGLTDGMDGCTTHLYIFTEQFELGGNNGFSFVLLRFGLKLQSPGNMAGN